MKRLTLAGILFSQLIQGQGTLTSTLTHEVKSPWLTPCSTSVTRNCIKGWRISNITSGRTVLFDIPAPATFSGTVTVSGSGPVSTPTGNVVAQTVGIDFDGAEILSDDSLPSRFGVKPGAPTFTVTIVFQP